MPRRFAGTGGRRLLNRPWALLYRLLLLLRLLWRRLLPAGLRPRAAEFHLLGLLTVPVIIAVTTVALWGGYQILGP